ncbi:hypothetical protein TPB0596_23110 [Tsukamurella pulmonis]|nr:hypothetical protein TPB0596_23110 [Tsukamurella pulmonis]
MDDEAAVPAECRHLEASYWVISVDRGALGILTIVVVVAGRISVIDAPIRLYGDEAIESSVGVCHPKALRGLTRARGRSNWIHESDTL